MQPALHAFPEQPADTAEATSRAGLEQAFALFNQMSSQLSESYSLLEERVTELKGQLALVSAQRMEELAEKERLANRLQSLLDLLPGGVRHRCPWRGPRGQPGGPGPAWRAVGGHALA